jgi:hypothetical protein
MRRAVYLLRIWREGDDEPLRITLEEPHTRERHAFATLQAMTQFLSEQECVYVQQRQIEHVGV